MASKLLLKIPMADEIVRAFDPVKGTSDIRIRTGYEIHVVDHELVDTGLCAKVCEFGPTIIAVPSYREASPEELELKNGKT
jgi:hypothetical protein